MTPDKLMRGVVRIDDFDRDPETLGQADERSNWPIEEEERFRWLEGYRLACELAADCPTTQIVSVADREADIDDIDVEAPQISGPRAEFLLRARVERWTWEPNPAAGRAASCKVREEVAAARLLTTRTIDLAETPQRPARVAHREVRALTVEVTPPHERSSLPSVTLNVVLVEEVGGPGDGTDVSWSLLTSLPIGTVEEVLRVIDYEVARWAAEIFFRTWKTGCRVEEIQRETQARLKNCLALYAIIAWRVLSLTYLNRTSPTLPGTVAFTESEWKSLWLMVAKKPLPTKPPTLADLLRLLTQLGGDNNRRGESPPGPQPMWIGLRRMADFAQAWQTFGQAT